MSLLLAITRCIRNDLEIRLLKVTANLISWASGITLISTWLTHRTSDLEKAAPPRAQALLLLKPGDLLSPVFPSRITSKLPGSGHHAHSSEQGDEWGADRVGLARRQSRGSAHVLGRIGSQMLRCLCVPGELCPLKTWAGNSALLSGDLFSVPEAPLAEMLAYDSQREARPLS